MSTDFVDAAFRHFADGDTLRAGGRYPNADQLYGFSAECALKGVMKGLGMQVTKRGAPKDNAHKVHMPELWMAFQSFAEGRLAARYLEPLDHISPFEDWDVDQRYWASKAISANRAAKHRDAAGACRASLEIALLDGVCR